MTYTVTMKWRGETLFTEHDYRPYAETQADIWRRLYPDAEIEITEHTH